MIRLRHKLFIEFFRLFDLGMFAGTLFYVSFYTVGRGAAATGWPPLVVSYRAVDGVGIAVLMAGWASVLGTFVRYDVNRFVELRPQVFGMLKATAAGALLVAGIGWLFQVRYFDRVAVLQFWAITCTLGMLSRLAIHQVLKLSRRSGLNFRHLLIIGGRTQAEDLAGRIERKPELGYKIEGLLLGWDEAPTPGEFSSAWPVLGTAGNLKAILQKGIVDEVIITSSTATNLASTFDAVRLGQQLGVVMRLLPDKSDINLLSEAQLEVFEGQYVLTFFREVLIWHLFAKRLLDITVSSLLLVLLSPLLLVVAILVKTTSPGPIFFSQNRVGMNRRQFRMHKFRSMYRDAEQRKRDLAHLNEMDGPVFKMANDPRITPVGRRLRTTSIDELPQLWNVLKGEMSLVGPRPPIPSEVDKYEWLNHHRLSIRPGITCLWQISGRSQLNFQQWMDLDRQYIENWSFWLDIQILFKTIPAVLLRKGAA